jgi:hypothetical protein
VKQRVVTVVFVLLLMSSVAFSQVNGRTEKFAFPVTQTGVLVGSCGNFNVLTDFVALISGTIVYDKSGAAVQTIRHFRIIGESIYYNSANPDKAVLGGPGENEQQKFDWAAGTVSLSGPSYKIRVPGYGLIFAETGHAVVDLTTEQFLFNSGHNQFVDQDLAALCNYLK